MTAAKYEQIAAVVAGLGDTHSNRLRREALDRIINIVRADRPVGESGPELFVPGASGKMSALAGDGPTLITGDPQAAADALARAGMKAPSDVEDDDEPSAPAVERPKDGRASAEAWRAYAESVGVEVPEKASKADIIALVEAAEG